MLRYRCFSGRDRFDELGLIPHPSFLCTVPRDPKARILSLYRFQRGHRDEVVDKYQLVGPRLARSLDLLDFLNCRAPVVGHAIDSAIACTLAGRVHPLQDDGLATSDEAGVNTPLPGRYRHGRMRGPAGP